MIEKTTYIIECSAPSWSAEFVELKAGYPLSGFPFRLDVYLNDELHCSKEFILGDALKSEKHSNLSDIESWLSNSQDSRGLKFAVLSFVAQWVGEGKAYKNGNEVCSLSFKR